MLQSVGEDIGELVIGRVLARVVMGVRRAELRQHRIDRDRHCFSGARGLSLRAVALAHRLPVEPVQPRVVEAVAHDRPDFVEGLRTRLGRGGAGLAASLSARRPCAERSRGGEGENVSARCLHGIQALRLDSPPNVATGAAAGGCGSGLARGDALAATASVESGPMCDGLRSRRPARFARARIDRRDWRRAQAPYRPAR